MSFASYPVVSPRLLSLALFDLLSQICPGHQWYLHLGEDFHLAWGLLGPAWQSMGAGGMEGSYPLLPIFISPWKAVFWGSDPRGTSSLLWEPELNLNIKADTSLVVQWLRLHAANAGGPGWIPGQGTRSRMAQLSVHVLQKIPHAAVKIKDPMQLRLDAAK